MTNFDPSEKDRAAENDVELVLPVAEEGEIIVLSRLLLQEIIEQIVHLNLPIDVECHAHVRQNDDNEIQTVHQRLEVSHSHTGNLR